MEINLPIHLKQISEEHKAFVRDNWDKMKRTDILDHINSERPATRQIGIGKLYSIALEVGCPVKSNRSLVRKRLDLSEEHEKYMIDNWNSLKHPQMLKHINQERPREKFLSPTRFYAFARRLGIYDPNVKYLMPKRSIAYLSVRNKTVIRKLWNKGTNPDQILTVINSTKDVKVSLEMINNYINDQLQGTPGICIGDSRKKRVPDYTLQERLYILNNIGIRGEESIATDLNKNRTDKIQRSSIRSEYKRIMKAYLICQPFIEVIQHRDLKLKTAIRLGGRGLQLKESEYSGEIFVDDFRDPETEKI